MKDLKFDPKKCANLFGGCNNSKIWDRNKLFNEPEVNNQFRQIFCDDCMENFYNGNYPAQRFNIGKQTVINHIKEGKIQFPMP